MNEVYYFIREINFVKNVLQLTGVLVEEENTDNTENA